MRFCHRLLIAFGAGILASLVPIIATLGDRTVASPATGLGAPASLRGDVSAFPQRTFGPLLYSVRATADMIGKSALDLNMESYSVGTLQNFDFAPTFIQGTPGQKMTLVLRNASSAPHNFTLPAQNIVRDVSPGAIDVVEVTFPTSGGLLFYCHFHTSKGMNGQLLAGRVEPQPLPMPAVRSGAGAIGPVPAPAR